jgi:hypothetical protein
MFGSNSRILPLVLLVLFEVMPQKNALAEQNDKSNLIDFK